MASRIFSWISFLSIAMYSWSVYYDRDISDQETHFLIFGIIAIAVSLIFGFIAKSVKLVVLNIVLSLIAFLSGSLFGVILDKWPFFWAVMGVGLIDFAFGGIAHKIGDDAPIAEEIKAKQQNEHINNNLHGIYKEYFHIYYKDIPKLTEEERLIIAACCDEDETRNFKNLIYKRIWPSGTILWYLTRKNKYYPLSETVSKAHLQDDGKIEWTEEYDPEEAALIKSYLEKVSSAIAKTNDCLNYVIRVIDADELVTANTQKDYYAYVCNASRRKIGLFNPQISWTDEFITTRNKDNTYAENVRLALSDLGDFFIGIIDLRYKTTYLQKLMYLAELPTNKRNIVWYAAICLGEQNTDLLTDASLIKSRITQLDSMLVASDQNREYFSSLFKAFDTAIENLGGKNENRFNVILNNWQYYRPAFIETVIH